MKVALLQDFFEHEIIGGAEKNDSVLLDYLSSQNIQTRLFFYPLHKQPCYDYMKIDNEFPNCLEAFEKGLSLPSAYSLTPEMQDVVINSIRKFFKK